MGIRIKHLTCAAIGLLAISSAHANLLTNGTFSASNSETATPTGWTQLGPSNGVIADSIFGTPSYNGTVSFYDLGGYGDSLGTQGDGIQQTIATTAGNTYVLTFGLSGEGGDGTTTLEVNTDQTTAYYTQTKSSADAEFQQPWTTETIEFTAIGASSVIAFIESSPSVDNGHNDPLIAGVDLELSPKSESSVPEPATFSLLGIGLALIFTRRRKAN